MKLKFSWFPLNAEAIIYLLFHTLYNCNFNNLIRPKYMKLCRILSVYVFLHFVVTEVLLTSSTSYIVFRTNFLCRTCNSVTIMLWLIFLILEFVLIVNADNKKEKCNKRFPPVSPVRALPAHPSPLPQPTPPSSPFAHKKFLPMALIKYPTRNSTVTL